MRNVDSPGLLLGATRLELAATAWPASCGTAAHGAHPTSAVPLTISGVSGQAPGLRSASVWLFVVSGQVPGLGNAACEFPACRAKRQASGMLRRGSPLCRV